METKGSDHSKQAWNERAKIYDKLDWTTKKQYLVKILAMCDLKSYFHVCDVGTGTGVIAEELSRYCEKVDAFDNAVEMLSIAKERRQQQNISYRLADAENVAYREGLFDCITARMCFHHIIDHHKAIQNCYRMLKTNGKLVMSEGIPPSATRKFYTEMFRLKETRRTYTIDNLVELFEYGGFEDIEIATHKMENVSINNWLDNSGLHKDKCKRIYNMHLDSSPYVKKAYNMVVVDGDIYMDWIFAIVKGYKR